MKCFTTPYELQQCKTTNVHRKMLVKVNILPIIPTNKRRKSELLDIVYMYMPTMALMNTEYARNVGKPSWSPFFSLPVSMKDLICSTILTDKRCRGWAVRHLVRNDQSEHWICQEGCETEGDALAGIRRYEVCERGKDVKHDGREDDIHNVEERTSTQEHIVH